MKFSINGKEWEIEEVDQDFFYKTEEDRAEGRMMYGQTIFFMQKIVIYKDLAEGIKRTTLLHELMHCYIGTYLTTQDIIDYNEELLCDISANSHDIIHKIVEDYFGVERKCEKE